MSKDFDPYYKWLGIPPRDQPADHYRLLGVDRLEDDIDVISAAADQRMNFLRQFQNGERTQLAQQLLNDVSTARVCLLDAEKKAAYDADLTQEFTATNEKRSRTMPPPIEDLSATIDFVASEIKHEGPPNPFFTTQQASTSASYPSKKRTASKTANERQTKKRLHILAVLSGAAILLLLGVFFSASARNATVRPETAQQIKPDDKPLPGVATTTPKAVEASNAKENKEQRAKNQDADQTAASSVTSVPKEGPSQDDLATSPTQHETLTEAAVEQWDTKSEPQADGKLSEVERARRRLADEYYLQEESNTWILANEQTRNLQIIEASLGQSGMAEGPQYHRELEKRLVDKETQIIERWMKLQRQPSDNGGPRDREFSQLNSWIVPTGLGPKVKDDMPILISTRRQVRAEFAARAENNPAKLGLIVDIHNQYAELKNDPQVSELLNTVDGTLAEPPEIPETNRFDAQQLIAKDSSLQTTESISQNTTNEANAQLDGWMEANFRKHAQKWKTKYRDELDEDLIEVKRLKIKLKKVLALAQSAIKNNPSLRTKLQKAEKNKTGFKTKKEPAVNRIARMKKVNQAFDRAQKQLYVNQKILHQSNTELAMTVQQVESTLATCRRLEKQILDLRTHPNTKKALEQADLELAPFSMRKLETESNQIDKMLKRATNTQKALNRFAFSNDR